MKFRFWGLGAALGAALVSVPAQADEAERRQAWFGDVHVHTRYSFDAYVFGVRRTPDDAYRYATGETIRHANGYDIRLRGGPLDFYAVSDHAEYLGVLPAMHDPNSPMSRIPEAEGMFSPLREQILAAFSRVFPSVSEGEPIENMDNRDIVRTTWDEVQSAADRYYRPGTFTTFAGYEFTSQPDAQNLHRVVLFRTSRRPELPFGSLNSPNPENLWDWLDELREDGIDGISIPHNSNVSNGRMFEMTTYDGGEMTREYAEQRMRNEPIVEMSQVKGTSDTHPALSPNDEWANFEIYETLLGTIRTGQPDGSYVRQALQRGLLLEQMIGFNPYRFGLIGSSDTHNAGGPVEEDQYFGKTGLNDGDPQGRRAVIYPGDEDVEGVASTPFYQWSAAGLAGVWAERNNREDIFAAFRRGETFATSGPRIRVRLFAGYDYDDGLIDSEYAPTAYAHGVPMGGELAMNGRGAPTFLAHAIKDPNSAGLQRVQIIRGWVEGGELREEIYDIACSRGRPNPETNRCADNGATINTDTCAIPVGQGAAELKVQWRDPDFDADRRAFYYLRVIENPTCRWSTWEANRLNMQLRPGIPLTIQERAWSSPIWIGV